MASVINPDDICKNARNWTLEGDSKLLEFMQSISQTLENRCTTTKKNINGMLLKLDETNIALGNTTNKLLALQHSQFVENRVYEEDETIANSSEVPVTDKKEKSELTSMESIQFAIDNGIKMMNKCYEKVSLDLDDSDDNEDDNDDDENGNINIAFRPKDPYLNQPIPFIIGSKDWKEKWHIGILESDIESDDDDEEQFSESSEDPSLSVSLPSNAATISGSESGSVWGLHPSTIQPQKDVYKHSSDDDLSSSKSDSIRSKAMEKHSPNNNNMDKKLQQTINKIPVLPRSAVNDTKPKIARDISAVLFPNNEPPEFKPVARKREKGLFDESDSENEDIVKDQQKSVASSSYFREQQPQRKTVNLFNDEPPEIDIPVEQPKRPLNLFMDSDDDDLFITTNSNRNFNAKNKKTSLFDDEPPVVVEPIKKVVVAPAKIVDSEKKISENKRRDLFNDDEDDDDDFNVLLNKKEKKIKRKEEVEEIIESVVKPILTKPKITNLFDDEDEPEDFFDTIMKTNKIETKQLEINKKIENNPKVQQRTEAIKKLDNLFDNNDFNDDDDFDIFNKKEKSGTDNQRTQIKTIKKMNLFDDDDPPVDDFINIPKESKQEVQTPNKLLPTIKPRKGLFDDDNFLDDDEGELFGTISKHKSGTNKVKPTKIDQDKEREISQEKNIPKELLSKDEEISKETASQIIDSLKDTNSKEKNTEKMSTSIETEISKMLESEISKGAIPKKVKDDKVAFKKPEVKKRNPDFIIKSKNSNLFGDDEDDNMFPSVSNLPPLESERKLSPPKKLNTNFNINVGALLSSSLKREPKTVTSTDDDPFLTISKEDNILTFEPKTGLFSDIEKKEEKEKIISQKAEQSEFLLPLDSTSEISDEPKLDNDPSSEHPQIEDLDRIEELPPSEKAIEDPNTINLFWDEPPMESETDDWLVTADNFTNKNIFDKFDDSIEKNKLPITPQLLPSSTSENKNSSALNYNPIGLFDDLPPDDDDVIFSTPIIQKKTQIYYDDTESFLSINLSGTTKVSSMYVMDEEPPVDDFDQQESVKELASKFTESKGKDETDEVKPPEKINIISSQILIDSTKTSSVAELIQAKNRQKSDEDIMPESPKRMSPPKKLNTNFNINVGALLPGARPPSLRKEPKPVVSDEFTSPESSDTNRDEVFDSTPRNTQNSQKPSDPNILTSLNKNRVKIQVKRRPSTRQGRKENYTKSQLMDDGSSSDYHNDVTPAAPIQSQIKKLKNIDASSSKSLFTDNFDDDSSKVVKPEKTKESIKIDFPTVVESDKPKVESKIQTQLDFPKLLESEEPKVESKIPTKSEPKIHFPKVMLESEKSRVESKSQKKFEPKIDFPKFFEPEKPKTESTLNIFNDVDVDDDDDDLFSNKSNKLVPSIKASATNTSAIKKIVKKEKQPKLDNVQKSSSNLFSSDEDQSIFSTKTTAKQDKKPVKLPTKSVSSVFPSDDEDDDSLFGSSKTANKKSFSFVKSKGSDKLFGDLDEDDNDDDIFKVKSQTVAPKKSQPTTKVEKNTKRAINTPNDPLADLLK